MLEQRFDVFLCHNSEDKPAVFEIAKQLQANGLKPWLDAWEIRPGGIWQFELEQQIKNIGSAAVFVGQQGLGPWQSEEIHAFLQEFIERKCPVIPVLLRDVSEQPQLPIFLKNRNWVDFRLQDPDPLAQLIWGVTGEKPGSSQQIKPEIAKTTLIDLDSALASSKLDDFLPTWDSQRLKNLRQRAETAIESSKIIQGQSPASTSLEDDLVSGKGMSYKRLQDLLKEQRWEEADQETELRMLQAVGRGSNYRIRKQELLEFPCTDLKTIDRLWVKYSDGYFGFSVQKAVYDDCIKGFEHRYKFPGVIEEVWEKFCNSIGWRANGSYRYYLDVSSRMMYSSINDSLHKGHFPSFTVFGEGAALFSRIQACGLNE